MASKMVHMRIPEELHLKIQRFCSEFGFQTEQEYIRTAIRKMNEEFEKRELIELLERHKGTVEKIERMSGEEKERFFEEFMKEDNSEIFREYELD
jgi:Arc/MetJ-type ribon-helix-helix transcriptional regulator